MQSFLLLQGNANDLSTVTTPDTVGKTEFQEIKILTKLSSKRMHRLLSIMPEK